MFILNAKNKAELDFRHLPQTKHPPRFPGERAHEPRYAIPGKYQSFGDAWSAHVQVETPA
jgi:hypothetical protein